MGTLRAEGGVAMGVWSWLILLTVSAALGTFVQYAFFSKDRGPKDFDWVFTAGGALLFGFTANVWYPFGPAVDGLNVIPALGGSLVGAAVIEIVYRIVIRPRQIAESGG
jgi:hypothetical protein